MFIRSCLPVFFLAALIVPAAAKPKDNEYKRADTNLYLRADIVKSDPTILIVTPDKLTQKGDSYFMPGHGPKEIYLQLGNDWIEPITPPSMPVTLGLAPDAMQIREPQGDVQIALPSNPASFSPAQDGTNIPNGTVVKTGPDGTAAVLFGGVNSARLMPNTEAGVSQNVTPTLRSTTVDLKSGAVFSKVGTRPNDPQKQDYEVHTFNGNAVAKGTDFVTISLPARTDVWVAQGTVILQQTDGKVMNQVTATETGPLEIMRLPAFEDPIQSMSANTESFTATLNFIPIVNLKLKALRDQMSKGAKLSANEKAYLKRIKKIPVLVKLDMVQPPPAPVPVPPPPPPIAAKPPASIVPAPPVVVAKHPHKPATVAVPVPAAPLVSVPDQNAPVETAMPAEVAAPAPSETAISPEMDTGPAANIPENAKKFRPPPKLDDRPVPSPAPGATVNPLPPIQTDATMEHPLPTSSHVAKPVEESAPAPKLGPPPVVSTPVKLPASAPMPVSTVGKPIASKSSHKKPTAVNSNPSDTSGNTAPYSTAPGDTVP